MKIEVRQTKYLNLYHYRIIGLNKDTEVYSSKHDRQYLKTIRHILESEHNLSRIGRFKDLIEERGITVEFKTVEERCNL